MNRDPFDAIVIGAGHNGLVCANILADDGLKVLVLERSDVVGGAARTEKPFVKAPNLPQSTGAYLLGLMPPELIQRLDLNIKLMKRDPHYFLPTTDGRFLLFGSQQDTKSQFVDFFSSEDYDAYLRLSEELDSLREDLAPTWLSAPLPIEETASKYVREELQEVFVNLCRGTILDYLNRFEFKSELVLAMFAVTDAFSGSTACFDTPGSGMNFLVHNMCRLPNSDGTWMVVEGGMGSVTGALKKRALSKGVTFKLTSEVTAIETSGNRVSEVVCRDHAYRAKVVITNADPFRSAALLGDALPDSYRQDLERWSRPGTTMKVNLALDALPTFTCLPGDHGQHRGTIHLLPESENVISEIRKSHSQAMNGELPDFPTIEWYIQTTVDPSLTDERERLSAALFVQWVPESPDGGWEKHAEKYATHLISICDRFAPDTSSKIADVFTLTPSGIESRFGMTRGHIHHIDNIFGFTDRHPYAYPIDGLYSCSAGTHPAGSVIGAAGFNAAQHVLRDMSS